MVGCASTHLQSSSSSKVDLTVTHLYSHSQSVALEKLFNPDVCVIIHPHSTAQISHLQNIKTRLSPVSPQTNTMTPYNHLFTDEISPRGCFCRCPPSGSASANTSPSPVPARPPGRWGPAGGLPGGRCWPTGSPAPKREREAASKIDPLSEQRLLNKLTWRPLWARALR